MDGEMNEFLSMEVEKGKLNLIQSWEEICTTGQEPEIPFLIWVYQLPMSLGRLVPLEQLFGHLNNQIITPAHRCTGFCEDQVK